MACHFCWSDVSMTKEHMLSVPMLRAFGLDRSRIAVDSTENLRRPNDFRTDRLEQISARIACGVCNSGFLHDLECEAAKGVRGLFTGGIDDEGVRAVGRWLVTRHHWQIVAQGHGRRAFEGPCSIQGVDHDLVAGGLPDYARLHALWAGESEAMTDVHVAVGRSSTPERPSTLLSSGQVTVRYPRGAPDRAATMYAIHLEGLVLEVVVCIVACTTVTFRGGMRRLQPGARLNLLPGFDIDTLDPKFTSVRLSRDARPELVVERPTAPGGVTQKIHVSDTSDVLGPWVSDVDRSWIDAGYPEGAPIFSIGPRDDSFR